MMLRQRSGGGGRGREGDDDESGNGGWKRVSNWLLRRQTWFAGTDTDNQNGMPSRRYIIIHPENRWYAIWAHFILVWAVYSSFFTPMEFGFFRGLPENLFLLDIAGQFAFLVDIVLHFLVAYRDKHTYRIVYNRNLIAIRYLKSRFCIDLLGCLPWDAIFKACGRKEALRYLLWIRISRAVRVTEFFEKLEKDIRINYLFTRIVKLLVVELYCTHTAACIFYYLATTLPAAEEGYTWIGSLQMGDYHYSHFRDIDLWKRYITSLYFAIVTMATVGYGEIHAVNVREMIFVMVYVSFDMVLGAYLLGNMTALIVKGSKTEKFRDKMDDVIKYMNINNLGRATSNEIKNHLRLQYDLKYTQATILRDLPASIHTKISVKLYEPFIKETPLFKGCSPEFIKHIAIKVHEEFFFPGEVIIEQGNVVDQLYIVCHGELEEIGKEENEEMEESSLVHLEACNSFGEVSFLCNSPYPYTIQAKELCKVLRLDKQSFLEMIGIYFSDGRTILNNLLEGKKNIRKEMLESNVSLCIEKSESQVIMSLNCVAYDGDYYRLKRLIEAGANPNKADYNGRSPLHVAASKGHVDITRLLIEKAVDINISDKFGNSPLLEAIKGGHEEVASLLVTAGALLEIDDLGNFLCTIVAKRDLNLLRRVLDHGVNPNAKNYDSRTPLHIAASEGLYSMVNLLLDAGATVFSRDRWDKTPIDDARLCGDKKIIQLIEVVRVSD